MSYRERQRKPSGISSKTATGLYVSPVSRTNHPPGQAGLEHEGFHRDRLTATRLGIKQERGAVTSEEQQQLEVVQTKMNGYWAQRLASGARSGNDPARVPLFHEASPPAPTNPAHGHDDREDIDRTGLPERLKERMETLSGFSMDDVRVHYRSSEPSRLQALAYTRGSEIHVAPGQERQLPHEAWHVVQQKQGRVHPTMRLDNTALNDDPILEREADVEGAKAASTRDLPASDQSSAPRPESGNAGVVQCNGFFSKIFGKKEEEIPDLPPPPSGGHAARDVYPVPPGNDPRQVAEGVTNAIAASPAPGVNLEPSETPQVTSTLGQPISVATAHFPEGEMEGAVQVEAGESHILAGSEGAAGINYSIYSQGDSQNGGQIVVDREPYGESNHEALRTAAGRIMIAPHIDAQIRRELPSQGSEDKPPPWFFSNE